MIDNLILTPIKIIDVIGGSVLRVIKENNNGYEGFGEAYFSTVESNIIRGWKKHKVMTLNIVVPVGSIRFVIYDTREKSSTYGEFQEVVLSRKNYCRLTIPPKVWVGFQGEGKGTNLLLNMANIPHDDKEVDHLPLESIEYNWRN